MLRFLLRLHWKSSFLCQGSETHGKFHILCHPKMELSSEYLCSSILCWVVLKQMPLHCTWTLILFSRPLLTHMDALLILLWLWFSTQNSLLQECSAHPAWTLNCYDILPPYVDAFLIFHRPQPSCLYLGQIQTLWPRSHKLSCCSPSFVQYI